MCASLSLSLSVCAFRPQYCTLSFGGIASGPDDHSALFAAGLRRLECFPECPFPNSANSAVLQDPINSEDNLVH